MTAIERVWLCMAVGCAYLALSRLEGDNFVLGYVLLATAIAAFIIGVWHLSKWIFKSQTKPDLGFSEGNTDDEKFLNDLCQKDWDLMDKDAQKIFRKRDFQVGWLNGVRTYKDITEAKTKERPESSICVRSNQN